MDTNKTQETAKTLEQNSKHNINADGDDRNQGCGIGRRTFLRTTVVTATGAAAVNLAPGTARAPDLIPDYSRLDNPLLVHGNPLENLDLVADPDKNFVVIMKDGVIYKNTLQ